MTYYHLSREERYQISALLKEGLTQSQIAANLSRHKATISREIARNSGLRGYRPRQASFLASGRSINSRNARHLRCQKKRRKRYAGGRDRRGQIIGRRPISERPKHVEKRRKIGHWEGDTLIGKGHKQAIVSLVERKSGYAVLAKVKNKNPKHLRG
jgi:IS30 family transposase